MQNLLKLLLTFLVITLFNNNIFSQPDIVKEPTGLLSSRVKKQILPDSSESYHSGQPDDYGTYKNSEGTRVLYRAIWEFQLASDIPQGYHAASAVLKYKDDSADYESFVLGYVNDFQTGLDYDVRWNLADSAHELGTYLSAAFGSTGSNEIPGLADRIDDAHQKGKSRIYLSFKHSSDFRNTQC